MKIQDIDMKDIDKAIQSLKGEREDNDQFNAGMYYIRDLIEPYYNNLIKENKRLNNIIDELEKDLDKQITFCTNEAESTTNDKYCSIALNYLKSLKNKLKELKGSDKDEKNINE